MSVVKFEHFELTIDEAWDRVESGQWVRHPSSYYARNIRSSDGKITGQYLAFGTYPKSIRSCAPFTIESVQSTVKRCGVNWEPYEPKEGDQ